MFNPFAKKSDPVTPPATASASLSWTERLKNGLAKTRQQLGGQLSALFGGGKINEEIYEELETILLTSDVGINATQYLLEQLRNRVKKHDLQDKANKRMINADKPLKELFGGKDQISMFELAKVVSQHVK